MKPVLIFLHGSGDCGAGVQRWVRSLITAAEYDQFEWEFPSAEPIPYSLAGGAISSIWFDRVGGLDPRFAEDTKSVLKSVNRLKVMIDEKKAEGVEHVVIGGFSMGGGIALQTAARSANITAAFSLSSYLCSDSQAIALDSWPPLFMGHGRADDFIKAEWGQATAEVLKTKTSVEFKLYDHTFHEMNQQEWQDALPSSSTPHPR